MRWCTAILTVAVLLLPRAAPAAGAEWTEVQKLLLSDSAAGDLFGEPLALDGMRLVVGVPEKGLYEGIAYVFERIGGRWVETAQLVASDGGSGDGYGEIVSLDGDVIAVTAAVADDQTATYVYERGTTGAWTQVAKLEAPDIFDPDGGLGESAISGDTLVGGAPADDDEAPSSGAVYVVERLGEPPSWQFTAKLKASDPTSNAAFGSDVSLEGDRLVVGSSGDRSIAEKGGSAYVFERDGQGRWHEVAKLMASEPSFEDLFGDIVEHEGDVLVFGVELDDELGNGSGAAYVFEPDGLGGWVEEAMLTASDGTIGDKFGSDVSISNGVIAVGAEFADGGGAVYVFEKSETGVWTEVRKLVASDEDPGDLGSFVGISGNTIVAGAPFNDEAAHNAGAVYVFESPLSLMLELSGSCPGSISFSVSGASPGGAVVVAYSMLEGQTVVGAGPCAGTELGLDQAKTLTAFATDGNGAMSGTRTVSAAACQLFLQAVDRETCAVSNTAQVP